MFTNLAIEWTNNAGCVIWFASNLLTNHKTSHLTVKILKSHLHDGKSPLILEKIHLNHGPCLQTVLLTWKYKRYHRCFVLNLFQTMTYQI